MADKEEDWKLARIGVSLFLNNKPEEAEALFSERPNSLHVKSARCFIAVLNVMMCWEKDNIQKALEILRDTEKDCDSYTGWLQTLTSKFFWRQDAGSSSRENMIRLERQIVLAETKCFIAALVCVQQSINGGVNGAKTAFLHAGWMIRKAWHIYRRTYEEILELYRKTFGGKPSAHKSPDIAGTGKCFNRGARHHDSNAPKSMPTGGYDSSTLRSSFPTGILTSDELTRFNERAEIARLMAAVSFGYGIFHVTVSLLPPAIVRLASVAGFEGKLRTGMGAVMHTRLSEDMRAPLASLALLGYVTLVRPLIADFHWYKKCVIVSAKQYIRERREEFGEAAIFSYFAGRIERLQLNIETAIEAYERAVRASPQREMKLLCLHEVAWCHAIQLNYSQAYESYEQLQREAQWGGCFYAYFAALCAGALNNAAEVVRIQRQIREGKRGENVHGSLVEAEPFIQRRFAGLTDKEGKTYGVSYYKLFLFELLYLWNFMSCCTRPILDEIIEECETIRKDEPIVGLTDLIKGFAHFCRFEGVTALKLYSRCIKQRRDPHKPSIDATEQHVSAHALYEMGRTLSIMDRKVEGVNTLWAAERLYRDYDFEDSLRVRIFNSLGTKYNSKRRVRDNIEPPTCK